MLLSTTRLPCNLESFVTAGNELVKEPIRNSHSVLNKESSHPAYRGNVTDEDPMGIPSRVFQDELITTSAAITVLNGLRKVGIHAS